MKKFNYSMSVDAWITIQIEANNIDEANEKLNEMSLEELIEEGYVNEFTLKDCDVDVEGDDLDEDEW